MTSEGSRIPEIAAPLVGLLALAAGFVGLALTTAPVAGWVATACVLFGLWGLGSSADRLAPLAARVHERIPERFRGLALPATPYIITIVVVGWTTWPAVLGEVPVSQDHAHHFLQSAIFTDDLLASGHLFGWTERVGAGIPFGDVYATAVYFVTGLLRIITFGFVSRATSYAFGIFLVWLIPTWAVVAWTRRILEGVTDVRSILIIAATLAGVFFAIDVGDDREGGWVYSMFHAVWPQVFATGLWLWSLLAMVRLAERPTTRRLGIAVITAGFAFWAHPMNALNLFFAAPLLFIAAQVASRQEGSNADEQGAEAPLHSSAWWLVPGFGLAAVIGYAWLSHIMGASDIMASFTAYGDSLEGYASRFLATGVPFSGSLALVAAAAAIGFAVALVRGGFERLFVAIAFVSFLLLTSSDLFASSDFGLSDASPMVMFKRFAITAKPLMFALAGLGVGAIAELVRRQWHLTSTAAALAIIAVSPLVYSGIDALPELVRTPSARFLTASDVGIKTSLGKIVDVVSRELDSTPGPKRVMVWHERGDHGDYALFAVAELGVGYLPTRKPPAHALRDFSIIRDLETATIYGASHIITRSDRKFPGAKLLGDYPPYKLWRINNAVGDGVRWFGANAQVETVEWSPMKHVIEVRNFKGQGELVFAIPPHPKWTYTQNGVPLETQDRRLEGGAVATRVIGVTDGVIVAEFSDTTTENVAFVLMLLVLLLSLAGIPLNRSLPLLRDPWPDKLRIPTLVATLLLGLIVLLVARQLGASALDKTWAKPGETVLAPLHRTDPAIDWGPKPFCVRGVSRNPRVGCDDSQLQPRLKLSATRGGHIPACMEVSVPDEGFLEMRFELPAGTTRVRGRFEPTRGIVPKHIANGKEKVLRQKFDVPASDAFQLRFDNGGRQVQEVCMELVAIGKD